MNNLESQKEEEVRVQKVSAAFKAFEDNEILSFLMAEDDDWIKLLIEHDSEDSLPKSAYVYCLMSYLCKVLFGTNVFLIEEAKVIIDDRAKFSMYVVLPNMDSKTKTVIYDVRTNKLLITSLSSYLNSLAGNQLLK